MNPRALYQTACNSRRWSWPLLALLSACFTPASAQQPTGLRPIPPWAQGGSAHLAPIIQTSLNQPEPGLPAPIEAVQAAPGEIVPGMVFDEGFVEAPMITNEETVAGDWSPLTTCPSSWYAQFGMAYLNVDSADGITRSRDIVADNLDFAPGTQIIFGRMFDCSEGWEVIYTGPFEWSAGDSIRDAGGNLNSTWMLDDPALGGIVAAEISAFNDAVFHEQRYESKLQSIEFHSKTWGWDVFAFTMGIRYLRFEEEFFFRGINQLDQEGVFRKRTTNDAFGPQLGIEMRYPFLPGWSVTGKYKGGLYANYAEANTGLINAGGEILRNNADDLGLLFMGEVGTRLNRDFGRRASFFVGYDLWLVHGFAAAGEQSDNRITRSTGRRIDSGADVWLSGISAGLEVSW